MEQNNAENSEMEKYIHDSQERFDIYHSMLNDIFDSCKDRLNWEEYDGLQYLVNKCSEEVVTAQKLTESKKLNIPSWKASDQPSMIDMDSNITNCQPEKSPKSAFKKLNSQSGKSVISNIPLISEKTPFLDKTSLCISELISEINDSCSMKSDNSYEQRVSQNSQKSSISKWERPQNAEVIGESQAVKLFSWEGSASTDSQEVVDVTDSSVQEVSDISENSSNYETIYFKKDPISGKYNTISRSKPEKMPNEWCIWRYCRKEPVVENKICGHRYHSTWLKSYAVEKLSKSYIPNLKCKSLYCVQNISYAMIKGSLGTSEWSIFFNYIWYMHKNRFKRRYSTPYWCEKWDQLVFMKERVMSKCNVCDSKILNVKSYLKQTVPDFSQVIHLQLSKSYKTSKAKSLIQHIMTNFSRCQKCNLLKNSQPYINMDYMCKW